MDKQEYVMEEQVFQAIKQKKISSQIVDQIKNLITNGQLKPGDSLPPERELMKVFNVSRPTLREALNMLSTMGFVQMSQRQRTKGKSLMPGSVTEPLRRLLKDDIKTSVELGESRTIIETANAQMAAERATKKDILRLEKSIELMHRNIEKNSNVSEEDVQFHLAVAEATHNKIQTHLMFSLYDLLKEKVELCYHGGISDILGQHSKIVEAIKKRDGVLARKRMEEHLAYVELQINQLNEDDLQEKRG